MKRKIFVVAGTRPEAIKVIPVYKELLERGERAFLVSSGQHKEMLQQVFNFFDIQPDFDLGLMKQDQSLSDFCADSLKSFDQFFRKHQPNLVIVQGDTSTAFTAALSAFYNQIIIAHVEAGLRTYNKYEPFPEEVNRRLISQVADIHFSPTEISNENLISEKITNTHVTGNTVVDALVLAKTIVKKNSQYYYDKFKDFVKSNGDNILVTGHRRESFGRGFKEITETILLLSIKYSQYNFIYPVHLNPKVKKVVHENLKNRNNIYLLDPVDYGSLIYLMMQSKLIMTDSGGIQEEAPSLNKPIIVMRNTTERPEGVNAGCAVLAGNHSLSIIESFEKIIQDKKLFRKMTKVNNPYGDGKASRRIVELMKSL